jgi:hypothetical protein
MYSGLRIIIITMIHLDPLLNKEERGSVFFGVLNKKMIMVSIMETYIDININININGNSQLFFMVSEAF